MADRTGPVVERRVSSVDRRADLRHLALRRARSARIAGRQPSRPQCVADLRQLRAPGQGDEPRRFGDPARLPAHWGHRNQPAEPRGFRRDDVSNPFSDDSGSRNQPCSGARRRGFAAIELFCERAAAVDDRFVLRDDNALPSPRSAAASTVFRWLSNSRRHERRSSARNSSRDRLDERFALLTRGGRDLLPRQQTLRATLDWSYELLGENERVLARRLSVFANGFSSRRRGRDRARRGDGRGRRFRHARFTGGQIARAFSRQRRGAPLPPARIDQSVPAGKTRSRRRASARRGGSICATYATSLRARARRPNAAAGRSNSTHWSSPI